jgi:hypothetical protein
MFLKELFNKVFGRKEEVTTSTKTTTQLYAEGAFEDKVKTPPESTSKPGGQKRGRKKKI